MIDTSNENKNSKYRTFSQNKIFPNIQSDKNMNNTKSTFNNIKNDDHLENFSTTNKNNLSQTNFKSYKNMQNNPLNIVDINQKSNNLSLNHSLKELNNNRIFMNKSVTNNNDVLLNSNINDKNENNNNKVNLNTKNVLNNNTINESNPNSDKNIPSHNLIISDLLIKTENFFNQLGLYLNERNKNFKNKKYQIIKLKKYDFNEYKSQDLIKEENQKSIKISKQILKKENDNKKYIKNNNRYFKENDNSLKSRNILIKNRSYNDLQNNNFKEINNNTNLNIKKNNIKVYNIIYKNKKMVSDEIIQTFNILENNKQNYQIKNNDNIILPYLPPSKEKIAFNNKINTNYIEVEPNKKNEIKIAEIKPVYPVYPYNRIINLDSLNNNKYNNNIHRKIILDMKEDFRHDDRYNYEQLMNNIKYKNKLKKGSFSSSYRFIFNSKNFNNSKKISKINDLYL